MNKSTIRKINATFWFFVAFVIMLCAYCVWSQNGPYTLVSFFASFVFHGGFCFFSWYLIDEFIRKKVR